MNSGIYKIINKETGKFYIGSTVNFSKRWREHKYMLDKNNHHCTHLQNSWNKHGAQCFDFEILEKLEPRQEILLEKEQIYLNNYANLYNICKYAGSPRDKKHSEETKKKIAKANKGKQRSLETIEKLKKINLGRIHSDDARQNMRIAQLGRTHSDISKQKMSIAQKLSNHERGFKPTCYVQLISPEGEVYNLLGYSKFCKDNDLDGPTITNVLRGKYKYHKKWTGRYLTEEEYLSLTRDIPGILL